MYTYVLYILFVDRVNRWPA